jgi:hypothetical protein
VDDIFIIFNNRAQIQTLHEYFDSLHPNIKFTTEIETNNVLPFLDVLLHRNADGTLSRSVFHKPSWSGLYLHFKSFAPISYKRSVVRTLFHRTRKIATNDFINADEKLLYDILAENGYPPKFIDKYSKEPAPITRMPTVAKKDVFIRLPYKGDDVSVLIRRRINAVIKRTFYAAKLVYIEETVKVPQSSKKDPIALIANSNVIYGFNCTCGCRYAGRTSRQLGSRIKEHVPQWLKTNKSGIAHSSITKHLFESRHTVDEEKAFRIIYRARNINELRIAEAVTIRLTQPILCVQKQMVMHLALPW